MPQWWEKKLQKYKACRVKFKKEIETVPSDLSPNVATRLMDLRDIRADIEKNGDKRKLLANIDAIIEAYTSKDLAWNDGLVTYWSKGKMISDGPKEFTWEDFEHYSEKHEGHQSFWVEGVCPFSPRTILMNWH